MYIKKHIQGHRHLWIIIFANKLYNKTIQKFSSKIEQACIVFYLSEYLVFIMQK